MIQDVISCRSIWLSESVNQLCCVFHFWMHFKTMYWDSLANSFMINPILFCNSIYTDQLITKPLALMLACSGASWNEVNFTHHKFVVARMSQWLFMEAVWCICLVHSCIKSHGFFHHQNIAQRLYFEFPWFRSITVAALSMLKFDTLDSRYLAQIANIVFPWWYAIEFGLTPLIIHSVGV